MNGVASVMSPPSISSESVVTFRRYWSCPFITYIPIFMSYWRRGGSGRGESGGSGSRREGPRGERVGGVSHLRAALLAAVGVFVPHGLAAVGRHVAGVVLHEEEEGVRLTPCADLVPGGVAGEGRRESGGAAAGSDLVHVGAVGGSRTAG